jgi:hypothetical protein
MKLLHMPGTAPCVRHRQQALTAGSRGDRVLFLMGHRAPAYYRPEHCGGGSSIAVGRRMG